MVKIKKGNLIAVVPYNTFKNIYEKQGWQLRVNKNSTKIVNHSVDPETNNEVIEEVENNIPEEVDLDSMNVNELKEYAAKNNIDISKANSKRELKAIIESTLDM